MNLQRTSRYTIITADLKKTLIEFLSIILGHHAISKAVTQWMNIALQKV